MPLARHRLKGKARCLPLDGRIDAVGQLPPRLLMALPRLHEPDIRIDAKGQRLLLAIESIAVTPVPPAVGRNEEVQPAGIRELLRPHGRFDAAEHGVSQHGVGISRKLPVGTNQYTNKKSRFQENE
jgi:hypothetical protein